MATKGAIEVKDVLTRSPLLSHRWKVKYRKEVRERIMREQIAESDKR